MRLISRVVEPEETTWDDGYRVLQVCDAGERVDVCVNVVCELLVAHAGEAIAVVFDCGGGDLDFEVYCVDQGYGGTWGNVVVRSKSSRQ